MESPSSGGTSGDVREVLLTFLRLGLTSFGGPIAHLQYFRRTLVEQRGWIDEAAYARIVAFCSVLPGPTSSQVGMMMGLARAGPAGAFAAWFGFTAPSAIVMACIAAALVALGGSAPPWLPGLLDGLLAAAAAVVLQAVVGLARSLCTDLPTALIAVGSLILTLLLRPIPGMQWLPIAVGAVVGIAVLRGAALAGTRASLPVRIPRAASIVSAALLCIVVAVTLLPRTALTEFLGSLVRAGSLAFGGGHVVLPLLGGLVRDGIVAPRLFFAGYGAAQAMPGPLFTFASFLGYANLSPIRGAVGALIATIVVFVPSFALIFALAPVWNRVASLPRAGPALRGANASVVGLLGSVLVDPILPALAVSWIRVAIAIVAFAAIRWGRTPPWIVVSGAALLGALVRA
jgi:chromate transporter